MKRFSFRLEPVLEYRSGREEKAIQEQSRARKKYVEQLDKLENICHKLKGALEAETGSITAEECLFRSLYIDRLKGDRVSQEKEVAVALRELEKKRQKMIDARRDRLALQKLKDKQYGQYVKDMERAETKAIDDQCMVMTGRKREWGTGNL